MDNSTAEELRSSVESAARVVAAKWPGVIDAEDAAQEIWVRLLESPGSVERVIGMVGDTRVNGLVAIGHQAANRYRQSYELFTGQVFYSTQDVRELLSRSALIEEKTKTDTERMDLFEGLDMLRERNADYARAVFEKYALGEPVEDGKYKLLQRAVDALTGCMNRVHRAKRYEFESAPGARKARTNSTARATSNSFYEDWDGRNGIQ